MKPILRGGGQKGKSGYSHGQPPASVGQPSRLQVSCRFYESQVAGLGDYFLHSLSPISTPCSSMQAFLPSNSALTGCFPIAFHSPFTPASRTLWSGHRGRRCPGLQAGSILDSRPVHLIAEQRLQTDRHEHGGLASLGQTSARPPGRAMSNTGPLWMTARTCPGTFPALCRCGGQNQLPARASNKPDRQRVRGVRLELDLGWPGDLARERRTASVTPIRVATQSEKARFSCLISFPGKASGRNVRPRARQFALSGDLH